MKTAGTLSDEREDKASCAEVASRDTGHHTLRIGVGTSVLLDVVRAGAAFLVSVNHAIAILRGRELSLGGFAVCLFFLLSGFLITFSVLTKVEKSQFRIHEFISDRIARIYTPYLPILIVTVIVEYFFVSSNWGLPGKNDGVYAFVGNLLMLQNYPIFQAATYAVDTSSFYIRPYNSAEPFWTVAIEFWIYMFVALLVLFLTGRTKSLRPIVVAVLLGAVPVVIWNSFAGGGNALSLTWALGALASFLFWRTARLSRRSRTVLGWLLIGYGAVCWPPRAFFVHLNAYDIPLNVFMMSSLLGAAILLHDAPMPKWLVRVAELVAAYSYSLYLTHNTIIVLFKEHVGWQSGLGILCVLAVTQVVAIAFYFVFERHYKSVGRLLRQYLEKVIYRPVV